MRNPKTVIIGNGYVGSAYQKLFPEALVYDEPKQELLVGKTNIWTDIRNNRKTVNECGFALIAVPTNLLEDGSLDTSIVEDVVEWLETDCILIKSALNPGTVERLKKQFPHKKIAVSMETIGEGNYHLPYWRYPHPKDPTLHQFLVIGGTDKDATACAEYIWEKMSPDLQIHLMTALEVEICKLMENTWGAMKVSFANEMYEICQRYGANYLRVLQGWGADGRVEKMHMRVVPGKRGWRSKCWDKDVPALVSAAKKVGYEASLISGILEANDRHLEANVDSTAAVSSP